MDQKERGKLIDTGALANRWKSSTPKMIHRKRKDQDTRKKRKKGG